MADDPSTARHSASSDDGGAATLMVGLTKETAAEQGVAIRDTPAKGDGATSRGDPEDDRGTPTGSVSTSTAGRARRSPIA